MVDINLQQFQQRLYDESEVILLISGLKIIIFHL